MEITHSYEGISQEYLKARKGTPKFAAFVATHAGLDKIQKQPLTIIELGAGSGQQTEFVEKKLISSGISQFKILVYDKSDDQLGLLKVRIKRGEISQRVIPIQHDFDSTPLPLESESVDLTYMAWVLHHLTNQQNVINDISRITRKGGRFFIYQVTIEVLKNHPLNEFFPMKYAYDKKRYPSLPRLKQMFNSAGFTFEKPYIIKRDNPLLIDRAFLESVTNTSLDSVLMMIKDNDPQAFARGVNRIQAEVKKAELSGRFREYIRIDRSIFWGIKS